MRESALQSRCVRWVRESYGGRLVVVNVHGGGWSNKGFPDLLVMGGGRVLAVELKAGTGYAPQPDQRVWAERLRRSGTPHRFCTGMDEFVRSVREVFGDEAC